MKKSLLVAVAVACTSGARAADAPITVMVDATRAPMHIFHARLSMPAAPGPMVLLYPKWLPGEHGPTGPIGDVAGLKFSASGKALAWRRDPVDMYAFHVDVPAGASALEVELDFLSPAGTEGFTSGASATAELAVVSWNQLLLYPGGKSAADLACAASLRLPKGWSFGTALPVARRSGDEVVFKPVPLVSLVDAPVIAGAHLRDVDLTPTGGVPHLMHVAADGAAALDLDPELQAAYARLVVEALALFGAHHYGSYHFLVTLSDHAAHFGLEHHECSDNRSYERAFIDEDRHRLMAGLLPHELVHSWNGKYRRPATLTDTDFAEPIDSSLLWVYEGLTTYLGDVLTARCGLWTPEEYRESLALETAMLQRHTGRTWRPLLDTAVAAQLLYEARPDWANWRREVDFYPEGALIWLEADVIIRQATGGRRSLDDFCRAFFGGTSGPPEVLPYRLEQVVEAINQIAPRDWAAFFAERVERPAPQPPINGITAGGWKLVYTEERPPMLDSIEAVREITDLSHSIGIVLDSDGRIEDTVPGMAADLAGVGPGMKLIAVNGRTWNADLLHDAIRATKAGAALELLVENAGYIRAYTLKYRDGERYPHLVRDESRPDLLSAILMPIRAP